MDDIEFLADDHSLLSSQVIHVVALLRAFDAGRYELAGLYIEILRQTEVLQSQLGEHFAYEEVTAFPHLQEKYPEYRSRLQAILAQHAGILQAFEQYRSVLNETPFPFDHVRLLNKGLVFETAFELHATEETQLLNEIGRRSAPNPLVAETE